MTPVEIQLARAVPEASAKIAQHLGVILVVNGARRRFDDEELAALHEPGFRSRNAMGYANKNCAYDSITYPRGF